MSVLLVGVILGAVAIYYFWPKNEKCSSKSERRTSSTDKKNSAVASQRSEQTQFSVKPTTSSKKPATDRAPASQNEKHFVSASSKDERRSNLTQTESMSLVPKIIPNPPAQNRISAFVESTIMDSKKEPNNISSSEQQLLPRNVEISRINYDNDVPTAREISQDSIFQTASEVSATPKKTKIPTLAQVDISPLTISKKVDVENDSTRTAIMLVDQNNNENKTQSLTQKAELKKSEGSSSKTVEKGEKATVNAAKLEKSFEAKDSKKNTSAKPISTVPNAAASSLPSKNIISTEVKKSNENEQSGRKDKKDKSNRSDGKKEKKSKKEKSSTSSDRKKAKKDKKSSSKQPKSGDRA